MKTQVYTTSLQMDDMKSKTNNEQSLRAGKVPDCHQAGGWCPKRNNTRTRNNPGFERETADGVPGGYPF
jgi:hypothetical protein